jgi:hypothetical protein
LFARIVDVLDALSERLEGLQAAVDGLLGAGGAARPEGHWAGFPAGSWIYIPPKSAAPS